MAKTMTFVEGEEKREITFGNRSGRITFQKIKGATVEQPDFFIAYDPKSGEPYLVMDNQNGFFSSFLGKDKDGNEYPSETPMKIKISNLTVGTKMEKLSFMMLSDDGTKKKFEISASGLVREETIDGKVETATLTLDPAKRIILPKNFFTLATENTTPAGGKAGKPKLKINGSLPTQVYDAMAAAELDSDGTRKLPEGVRILEKISVAPISRPTGKTLEPFAFECVSINGQMYVSDGTAMKPIQEVYFAEDVNCQKPLAPPYDASKKVYMFMRTPRGQIIKTEILQTSDTPPISAAEKAAEIQGFLSVKEPEKEGGIPTPTTTVIGSRPKKGTKQTFEFTTGDGRGLGALAASAVELKPSKDTKFKAKPKTKEDETETTTEDEIKPPVDEITTTTEDEIKPPVDDKKKKEKGAKSDKGSEGLKDKDSLKYLSKVLAALCCVGAFFVGPIMLLIALFIAATGGSFIDMIDGLAKNKGLTGKERKAKRKEKAKETKLKKEKDAEKTKQLKFNKDYEALRKKIKKDLKEKGALTPEAIAKLPAKKRDKYLKQLQEMAAIVENMEIHPDLPQKDVLLLLQNRANAHDQVAHFLRSKRNEAQTLEEREAYNDQANESVVLSSTAHTALADYKQGVAPAAETTEPEQDAESAAQRTAELEGEKVVTKEYSRESGTASAAIGTLEWLANKHAAELDAVIRDPKTGKLLAPNKLMAAIDQHRATLSPIDKLGPADFGIGESGTTPSGLTTGQLQTLFQTDRKSYLKLLDSITGTEEEPQDDPQAAAKNVLGRLKRYGDNKPPKKEDDVEAFEESEKRKFSQVEGILGLDSSVEYTDAESERSDAEAKRRAEAKRLADAETKRKAEAARKKAAKKKKPTRAKGEDGREQ